MTQLVWISVLDSRVTWPNDSRLSGFEQQKCMFLLFWSLEYRTQSPARAVPTGSLREVVSQYFSWLPKFVNHPWGSLVYSLITHLCLLCKSSSTVFWRITKSLPDLKGRGHRDIQNRRMSRTCGFGVWASTMVVGRLLHILQGQGGGRRA